MQDIFETGFGVMMFGFGVIMVGLTIGCGIQEMSKYNYCKERSVPYGICDSYLKENFATSNVKFRVKDE